jgi:hypothetical protein
MENSVIAFCVLLSRGRKAYTPLYKK